MQQVTLALMQAAASDTPSEKLKRWVEPLNRAAQKYDINTPNRIACFLGQTAHESGGFIFVKENLNYSTDGLLKTFPKYFPSAEFAAKYARNPEMIANRVYANRMGNGPEESGDGWRFRGAGFIQLTGKNNYVTAAEAFDMTIDDFIQYLFSDEGIATVPAWWWDAHGLNILADTLNNTKITRIINGGLNGFDDRLKRTTAVLGAIGGS